MFQRPGTARPVPGHGVVRSRPPFRSPSHLSPVRCSLVTRPRTGGLQPAGTPPCPRHAFPGIKSLLLGAAVLTSTAGANAHAQDLVTDRPDQTESATVVPRGLLQLETGYLFTRGRGRRQPRGARHAVPHRFRRAHRAQARTRRRRGDGRTPRRRRQRTRRQGQPHPAGRRLAPRARAPRRPVAPHRRRRVLEPRRRPVVPRRLRPRARTETVAGLQRGGGVGVLARCTGPRRVRRVLARPRPRRDGSPGRVHRGSSATGGSPARSQPGCPRTGD